MKYLIVFFMPFFLYCISLVLSDTNTGRFINILIPYCILLSILWYFIYPLFKRENRESNWKWSSELTWCSVHALQYGFHNVNKCEPYFIMWVRDREITFFRLRKSFKLYPSIPYYTEVSILFKRSRYQIRETIVITQNYNSFQKLYHKIIYYVIICLWIIAFISSILTFAVPIFIMLLISVLTEPSFQYQRLARSLWKQSMESLWFEKSFDAFSRDPVEARMIITPAFMDRLEDFTHTWNLHGKIRMIWENDTFILLYKWDIGEYGRESDGNYTLIKSLEEALNLSYYSLPETNINIK